mgnify:CR=1 FL=1
MINDTLLLFRRSLTNTLRNPVWVMLGLFQPVLYLLLFAPLLENLESGVTGLTAPPDMTRRLENLSSSVTDYKHSWLTYQSYLQDQNQPYDYVNAAPLIERITIAWEGYQAAHRQAKEALMAAR